MDHTYQTIPLKLSSRTCKERDKERKGKERKGKERKRRKREEEGRRGVFLD